MKRSTLFSALALIGAVLLAGCGDLALTPPPHGQYPSSDRSLDAVGHPPEGGNFIQETAHDYAGLANLLSHSGSFYTSDYVDVDYFARKGLAAEHGALMQPEFDGNWAIPGSNIRALMAQERLRLVRALDGGGRDRFPGLAARAQVDYDCWLERTEDDWQKEAEGACYKDYLATMTALEQALVGRTQPVGAREYNVYFEYDRANLTPEGRTVIDTVAETVKGEPDIHINLVGKADRTGTDPYNMALSHRRAAAVKARLLADGIPESRISDSWDGFRNPPIPTAPSVREPRNRVVVVTLQ